MDRKSRAHKGSVYVCVRERGREGLPRRGGGGREIRRLRLRTPGPDMCIEESDVKGPELICICQPDPRI
eukprot:scaffold99449_cov18-Tisochrysis_lutea.AAC.8